MFRNRVVGFTLIELLIVVLIIAILAAIAVPNFLEFQTRAKASRVMADMRSISVALEAYRVDQNEYPPNVLNTGTGNIMSMSGMMYMPFVPFNVTTPIAYMSDLPLDTFHPIVMLQMPSFPHKHTFMYFNSTNTRSADSRRMYRNRIEGFDTSFNGGITPEWFMVSTGPDQKMGAMAMQSGTDGDLPIYMIMTNGMMTGSAMHYDPTNGTVSQGDIVHYGP